MISGEWAGLAALEVQPIIAMVKFAHYMGEGPDYWVVSTVDTNEQGMPTEAGAINGGIYKRTDPQMRPINYVAVESVDEYLKKATALGATITLQKTPIPGMGYFAQLIDPQGNPFALFQNEGAAT